MTAIKTWARSIFVLTVFSSTALLLVPKSMAKQARFVAEMLLLLCVIAPLTGLFTDAGRSALALSDSWGEFNSPAALERFLASETCRRVREMGTRAAIPIQDVRAVAAKGGFTLAEVKIWLKDPVPNDALKPFVATLSAFLGVTEDTVIVIQPG